MGNRVTAAALAAAVVVLTAGCGSKPATSTEPTRQVVVVPSPTPAANAYVASVMRTRGLGTADAAITATSRVGGQERSRTATGGVDLSRGYGSLVWTDASGATVRELTNGKGLFVQSEVPDGTWIRYEGPDADPTGQPSDALRGLGTLGGLRADGVEVVGGQSFQRYIGREPATEVALGQLGLDDATARTLAAEAADESVTVTVWIDPAGRVVRIDRALDLADTSLGPVSAITTTRLTDFSAGLDLSPPPSESVSVAASSS